MCYWKGAKGINVWAYVTILFYQGLWITFCEGISMSRLSSGWILQGICDLGNKTLMQAHNKNHTKTKKFKKIKFKWGKGIAIFVVILLISIRHSFYWFYEYTYLCTILKYCTKLQEMPLFVYLCFYKNTIIKVYLVVKVN